jgi:transposase
MTGKQLIESQIGVALGMKRTGASQRQIAAELGVQQFTISCLFLKYTTTQFRKCGPRREYKRATTKHDARYLARVALKFRRMSLQAVTNDTGLSISKTTVQRRLKELGINKRVVHIKPHLTPQHMATRLEWALEHENRTVEQWGNVIWSDEPSIQIGVDPRQTMVFRRPSEAFLPDCLCPSFKSK